MSKNSDLVYNWAKDIYNILIEAEKSFDGAMINTNAMAQKGIRKMLTAKGYAQAIMATVEPESEPEYDDEDEV